LNGNVKLKRIEMFVHTVENISVKQNFWTVLQVWICHFHECIVDWFIAYFMTLCQLQRLCLLWRCFICILFSDAFLTV